MTTQEITSLLDIPASTLSDWNKNPKRNKLYKLLYTLNADDVSTLLAITPLNSKFSPNTRTIKLSKKQVSQDLLWSREEGSDIKINNLISVYLNTPNQKDIAKLIELFGEKRVREILNKNKAYMNPDDYNEVVEQIEYAISTQQYNENYPLPPLEDILSHPKQRYLDVLVKSYSHEKLLNIARANNINFTAMFQLKKMLGINE